MESWLQDGCREAKRKSAGVKNFKIFFSLLASVDCDIEPRNQSDKNVNFYWHDCQPVVAEVTLFCYSVKTASSVLKIV